MSHTIYAAKFEQTIRKSMLKLTTNFGFHDLFLKYHTNYIILDEYEWKLSTHLYISIWTDNNTM
jgi:hypothetical protein